MMTSPDVFWQLFRTSGHVGAYLLYTWYDQATRRSTLEQDELGVEISSSNTDAPEMSSNGQLG